MEKNKEWKYVCNYGDSRRATSTNAFGTSVMKNNAIRPILLACSHTGLGKKAKKLSNELEK